MERIYVTESGMFNKYGQFESIGVIGVDKEARNAISYIADQGALAINRKNEGFIKEITYKIEGCKKGFRISIHSL